MTTTHDCHDTSVTAGQRNTMTFERRVAATGATKQITVTWIARNVICCRWANGRMQGGWDRHRTPQVWDTSGCGTWVVAPVQCGGCGTQVLPRGLKVTVAS